MFAGNTAISSSIVIYAPILLVFLNNNKNPIHTSIKPLIRTISLLYIKKGGTIAIKKLGVIKCFNPTIIYNRPIT